MLSAQQLGVHSSSLTTTLICRGGGIGRRAGLKIRCPQGREGSSPSLGTFRDRPMLERTLGHYGIIESLGAGDHLYEVAK